MRNMMSVVLVMGICFVPMVQANELGLPSAVLAALDNRGVCVRIAQTGEEISYVYEGGYHAGRSAGKMMRFITASTNLPFTGNVIIVASGGTVSRRVVDVEACNASAAATEKTEKVITVQQQSVRNVLPAVVSEVSQRKIAEEQPAHQAIKPIATSSSSESGDTVYVASFTEAMKTANVTYARFNSMGDGGDKDREGRNVSAKLRFQPFRVGNLTYGGYAVYSDGDSDSIDRRTGRLSTSEYTTMGGGFSGEYDHGDYMKSMIDLGVLHQETDGAIPAKNFWSHQEEWQSDLRYALSSEYRRENGMLALPYWEVGLHWIYQLDVDYEDSRGENLAYDNSHINLFGTLDLYDWYLGESNAWRITPALHGQLGYLSGKNDGYFQGGLGAKLAFYGQESFEFWASPRWMFESGDNRFYQIGTIKVDNLFRAISASGVREKPQKD